MLPSGVTLSLPDHFESTYIYGMVLLKKTALVVMSAFLSHDCLLAQIDPLRMDSLPVQESVMVTVEEDFGPGVTTVAGALLVIRRNYEPFDGQGRTFAILDAFGSPMADGSMHISMHISAEKAGKARLVHAVTRKTLWECTITPGKDGNRIAPHKYFKIYIEQENEPGKYYTVDGTGDPATIFECRLDETKVAVKDYWKDQTVKEFIFIYSACGCPVHAKFRRSGWRSMYEGEDHVFFPDDPAVQQMIHQLMSW